MSLFRKMERPSSFRQIAAGMWKAPNYSAIYGSIDVDATPALEHLKSYSEKTGIKVTMTHLVAQALAQTIHDHPELNAKVHWGRILLRQSVDVFMQVAAEDGRDLSGVKVDQMDRKTLGQIAEELSSKSKRIRTGDDPALKKSRNLFRILPGLLVRPILWISDFLVNELHLDLKGQGMPRDPFGAAMVTSVGMLGIDTGYAPFVPISRCPIIILINAIADRPWVENGQVVVRPVLRLTGTFDHRVIDGYGGALMASGMKDYLGRPGELDDLALNPKVAPTRVKAKLNA